MELSRKLKKETLGDDLVNIADKATETLTTAEDLGLVLDELPVLINELESKMKEAAKKLEFEEATKLRDRIKQLRQIMKRK